MKVRFTARAQRRVEVVDAWWRDHRRETPELFKQELAAALELLETSPPSGTPHCRIRDRLFRRVLMAKTRQWLYYRVVDEQELIIVHSVWGAQRGRDPKLP